MKPEKAQSINNARTLLRQSELGVLSTHSKSCEGFPFGSVSTYLSTHTGDIIFYISDLAQHTRNIHHDSRMCLTVFAGSEVEQSRALDDPNAGARLSILGHARQIDEFGGQKYAERFFTLYPQSRGYQNTHDFEFYKLSCERVRFIGGFGDIHWISKEDWLLSEPEWAGNEQSMVDHMNEDHVDAMQLICEHHFGFVPDDAQMLTINPDGCFIKCDSGKPLYVAFEQTANSSQDVRKALVKLTNNARAALNRKAS